MLCWRPPPTSADGRRFPEAVAGGAALHERRIKHLETGGHCQGAGCCRGLGHPLIPHHVDAYARCGTTSLGDTVLFCESDHAALHRGQTITLKDGRRLNANSWVA